MEFRVKTNKETYNLEAFVKKIGRDFLVVIWGGNPHIGAIAAAQPRPSLKDKSVRSATASVFCYPGHKDDIVAKEAAEKISSELNTNVTVTVGIHFDDIDEAGIKVVIENSRQLIATMIEEITTQELK